MLLPPEGMPVRTDPTMLSCTGCEWVLKGTLERGSGPCLLHTTLAVLILAKPSGDLRQPSRLFRLKTSCGRKKGLNYPGLPYIYINHMYWSQSLHQKFPWVVIAQISQRKHKSFAWAPNFVFHFTWWKTKWKFSDVKPTFHFLRWWSVAGKQPQCLKASGEVPLRSAWLLGKWETVP